ARRSGGCVGDRSAFYGGGLADLSEECFRIRISRRHQRRADSGGEGQDDQSAAAGQRGIHDRRRDQTELGEKRGAVRRVSRLLRPTRGRLPAGGSHRGSLPQQPDPHQRADGGLSVQRAERLFLDHSLGAHPAGAGGFGMTVLALEQRYAGHAAQALALAAQVPGGAYYTKWIIAVDEDIDPTDMDQVIWAMSSRCNPIDDIDVLRNTWSTWLDPTQNPPEKRPYGSKALINACKEHRHLPVFSKRTALRKEMYDKVAGEWKKLGLPGEVPT